MYRSARSRICELVKKFPMLIKVLPLKINEIDGIHDIARVRDLEFVIIRNVLDMRESLVIEDFAKHNFLLEHLTPARFLDIGCHIGTWSLFFDSKDIEVVSVDANAELVTCLQASMMLNGFNGMVLHSIVGPSSIQTVFVPGVTSLTGSAKRVEGNEIGISSTTLQSLLSQFSPDFVKMDIEGWDIDCILETSCNFLKRVKYFVLELGTNDEKISKLIDHLENAGLRPVGFFSLSKKYYDVDEIKKLQLLGNLHFSCTQSEFDCEVAIAGGN